MDTKKKTLSLSKDSEKTQRKENKAEPVVWKKIQTAEGLKREMKKTQKK